MESSFEDFLPMLADNEQPIPLEHIKLLSDMDSDACDALNAIWLDLAASRRLALLEHCGRLAEENIEFLFEALNRLALADPESTVRVQAVRNLWECEDADLIQPLNHMLLDAQEADERAAAAEMLGHFVLLTETNDAAAAANQELVDNLLLAVREDPSAEVRRRSLESLGYATHEEVADIISRYYASADESDQGAAIIAMGRSADPMWNDVVIKTLQHSSPFIRLQAARAAGELEIKEAVEELIEVLSDIDARNQAAAVWSLGQIGGERAREALLYFGEQNENDALATLLEEALEHLAFVDGSDDFLMLDFNEDRGFEL